MIDVHDDIQDYNLSLGQVDEIRAMLKKTIYLIEDEIIEDEKGKVYD